MKEKFKLKDFAAKYNLQTGKKECFGVYNGYRIHVKYSAMANPACLITVVTDTKGRDKDLEKYLEKNKKQLKLTNYGVVGIGVMVSPQLYAHVFEQIERILDKITAQLKKSGCPGAEVCPYCGGEMNENCVDMVESGIPFRAHAECYERAYAEAKRREEIQISAPPKKGMGALGACLGAMFGAILFFLMYIWWDFAAIGTAVGVFFAVYLYGKLGGKNTPFKVVCCALIPLFLSLLVFIGCLFYKAALAESGVPLPDTILNSLANDGKFRMSFTLNLIFIFVFDAGSTLYPLFSYLRSRKRISANMYKRG